jgi:hypothetical protein
MENLNQNSSLSLQQRMEQRDKNLKIGVVKQNPGPGQITLDELFSFDPQASSEESCSSAALMIAMSQGGLSRQKFIEQLSEDEIYDTDEENEEPRIVHTLDRVNRSTETLENMIDAGVLIEKDGKIYSNAEMIKQ